MIPTCECSDIGRKSPGLTGSATLPSNTMSTMPILRQLFIFKNLAEEVMQQVGNIRVARMALSSSSETWSGAGARRRRPAPTARDTSSTDSGASTIDGVSDFLKDKQAVVFVHIMEALVKVLGDCHVRVRVMELGQRSRL